MYDGLETGAGNVYGVAKVVLGLDAYRELLAVAGLDYGDGVRAAEYGLSVDVDYRSHGRTV